MAWSARRAAHSCSSSRRGRARAAILSLRCRATLLRLGMVSRWAGGDELRNGGACRGAFVAFEAEHGQHPGGWYDHPPPELQDRQLRTPDGLIGCAPPEAEQAAGVLNRDSGREAVKVQAHQSPPPRATRRGPPACGPRKLPAHARVTPPCGVTARRGRARPG